LSRTLKRSRHVLASTENAMSEARRRQYKAIVIGISTGGVGTLKALLGALPKDFPLPILIVQHLCPDSGDAMAVFLDELCAMHVKEADEQERPTGGWVYLAPANYHLMVEPDGRLGLSTDPPVNFSRPSVDVLFETAAEAFGEGLIGVVLTGAGIDGSRGLKRIKDKGGVAVVQDPDDAAADSMPRHAMAAVHPDHVVTLSTLPQLFINLSEK
jgi:two-component system chemotaxis response regulator CheB